MPEAGDAMAWLIYAIIAIAAVWVVYKTYAILRTARRRIRAKLVRIERAYNKVKRFLSGAKKKESGQSRHIPSAVKQEVWARDGGRCVICGSRKNLCYDHDLPFSKGGTSLEANNIRILCRDCNLKKSDKIE